LDTNIKRFLTILFCSSLNPSYDWYETNSTHSEGTRCFKKNRWNGESDTGV